MKVHATETLINSLLIILIRGFPLVGFREILPGFGKKHFTTAMDAVDLLLMISQQGA